ncbi:MAG: FHA domain-containing protein [Acidobacteria bacterium]|nr:FHA domain-containing protein [Acidobacteriota bacterium]MCA1610170.1 FHA domain-containing protein [Acidobacteriota bacterium]MCA1617242.1 FHA domain-containing protein [Acidobacteriota bacterium]
MREDLGQIDVSMIADLARIKKEEELLEERLVKMEAGKQKVSAKVYRRVREDYESRQASFRNESIPLQDRARREYQKLREIRGKVEASLEEVALEKEELEFRRDLGEYADGQFQERLHECEQRLAEQRGELERIDSMGKDFLDAFHSEKDLETPSSEPAAAPEATASKPAAPAPPAGDATAIRPSPSLTLPSQPLATPSEALRPAGAAPGAEPSVSETVIGSGTAKGAPPASPDATRIDARVRDSVAATRPQTVPTMRTGPPPPPAGPPPAATTALPRPRLLIPGEGGTSREHVLAPGTTSIGRSPKSDLCLPQGEVSRHHADISFGPDGYKVLDMGSPNGIFVNGKRVKEQLLAEGDVILIGMQKLTYRA